MQGTEGVRGAASGGLCAGGSDNVRPHQRPARKNVGDQGQNVFIKLLYKGKPVKLSKSTGMCSI